MSAEHDRVPARLPMIIPTVNAQRLTAIEAAREEAEEARRHAAEIGDYVTAQRWLWHERLLATQAAVAERP
jgi:hypothetical protein